MTMPDHTLHVLDVSAGPQRPHIILYSEGIHPPETSATSYSGAMQDDWQKISRHVVERLISSMRRRCQAVVRVHGGHNRY